MATIFLATDECCGFARGADCRLRQVFVQLKAGNHHFGAWLTYRRSSVTIDSMNTDRLSLDERAKVHAALGEPARLAIVDTLALGDSSPGELAAALELPTNLLAHHVNVLTRVGLVVRTRSEGDRRRTYLRLVPESLDGLSAPAQLYASRVVFVCTHNSARSQLAAALWTLRSAVPAVSAGTTPARRINPRARRVARRHGLALGQVKPQHVSDVLAKGDLVVAVCDAAYEGLTPSAEPHLHWSVPDPAPYKQDVAFEAAFEDLSRRIDRVAPAVTLRSLP